MAEVHQACGLCAVVAGQSATAILHADDMAIVIASDQPKARVHLLLVPRKHVASIDGLSAEDNALWVHLLLLAQRMARAQGVDVEAEGYQIATSAGRHLSRFYPHLHVHLLSGTPLSL